MLDLDGDGDVELHHSEDSRTVFAARLGAPDAPPNFVAADTEHYEAEDDWLHWRPVFKSNGAFDRFATARPTWESNHGDVWLQPTDINGDGSDELLVTKKGGQFVELLHEPAGMEAGLRLLDDQGNHVIPALSPLPVGGDPPRRRSQRRRAHRLRQQQVDFFLAQQLAPQPAARLLIERRRGRARARVRLQRT